MSITRTPKAQKPSPLFDGQSTATTSQRRPRNAETDFVCSALDLLARAGLLSDDARTEADKALRQHFKGSTYYIAASAPTGSEEARRVLARFNGRNPREVARELGVSRATVYRKLKQPGGTTFTDPRENQGSHDEKD